MGKWAWLQLTKEYLSNGDDEWEKNSINEWNVVPLFYLSQFTLFKLTVKTVKNSLLCTKDSMNEPCGHKITIEISEVEWPKNRIDFTNIFCTPKNLALVSSLNIAHTRAIWWYCSWIFPFHGQSQLFSCRINIYIHSIC